MVITIMICDMDTSCTTSCVVLYMAYMVAVSWPGLVACASLCVYSTQFAASQLRQDVSQVVACEASGHMIHA